MHEICCRCYLKEKKLNYIYVISVNLLQRKVASDKYDQVGIYVHVFTTTKYEY